MPETRLTEFSWIMRAEQTLFAMVGTEAVMLNPDSNAYYDTSAVGAAIWALLDQPRRVAEVVDTLTARYDVPHATCLGDVVVFLEQAVAEGLIVVCAEPEPPAPV